MKVHNRLVLRAPIALQGFFGGVLAFLDFKMKHEAQGLA